MRCRAESVSGRDGPRRAARERTKALRWWISSFFCYLIFGLQVAKHGKPSSVPGCSMRCSRRRTNESISDAATQRTIRFLISSGVPRMALKATIYKADLQVADMDRHYYADHALTIARHPSETDERMMARVLMYALYAQEGIAFTKGLFEVDEPEVWVKDLTGQIKFWIDIGQPDEG